jgi:predicted dehydrogenase
MFTQGNYTKQVQAMDDVEITAVWDEEPQRGKEWADRLGVSFEKTWILFLKERM